MNSLRPPLRRLLTTLKPSTHPQHPFPYSTRPRPRSRPSSTSTSTPPPPTPPSSAAFSKLPPRLKKYLTTLRAAPASHITAFLILHELTAIVPLAGLWWVLHHFGNISPPSAPGDPSSTSALQQHWAQWVSTGTARFGGYLERQGWGGWRGMEPAEKVRAGVELGVAWAVVKAALPVRVGGCLWATPWVVRGVGRMFGRGRGGV